MHGGAARSRRDRPRVSAHSAESPGQQPCALCLRPAWWCLAALECLARRHGSAQAPDTSAVGCDAPSDPNMTGLEAPCKPPPSLCGVISLCGVLKLLQDVRVGGGRRNLLCLGDGRLHACRGAGTAGGCAVFVVVNVCVCTPCGCTSLLSAHGVTKSSGACLARPAPVRIAAHGGSVPGMTGHTQSPVATQNQLQQPGATLAGSVRDTRTTNQLQQPSTAQRTLGGVGQHQLRAKGLEHDAALQAAAWAWQRKALRPAHAAV